MDTVKPYRNWRVVQTVELGAPARTVWELVGGFYILHQWHPDIQKTEVPPEQTECPAIRRLLTFPGQPKTTEELVSMDSAHFHYRYKWHSGEWGEKVQQYHAEIRLLEIANGARCIMQWASTFYYFEDALSEFYWNGFRALQKRFPLP